MSTRQDITIEQIKEKIRRSLIEKRDIGGRLELEENKNLYGNKDFISSSLSLKSLKGKFINYGLRQKNIIKKIPILDSISKKLYHSLSCGFLQNDNPQPSTQEKKNFKSTIKKIPIVGYLIWCIYMVLKSPLKISELYSELIGLINRDVALESRISELYSELIGLKNRDESDKRLGTNWPKFYSKEITKEDMEGNINHHRYFIDLIVDWANRCSDHHIPKLLEVGVGTTATMSIYLSKRSFEVVGLDLDPLRVAKAIETNNKLGGYVKFIAMDAFDLPKFFKENTFDIAFSQGTMEHFNNDELEKILNAQLAVAKYAIFSVPSVNWPQKDFGNERKMTAEEWERMLKYFGIKIEYISYYQEGDLHIAAVITSGDK